MDTQLNPAQRAAVSYIDGPSLVLAGAGSGKTRVITEKIAWLIAQKHASADQIVAVTFTNKAAREMRDRASKLLQHLNKKDLQISTFHALGLKILRQHYEAAGLRAGFTIADKQDATLIIRELLQTDMQRPDKEWLEGVQRQISWWKNCGFNGDQCIAEAQIGPVQAAAASIFSEYQQRLQACNQVDLDDLLVLPVQLLTDQSNIRQQYQLQIRFLLVDEYQDTNGAQYQLVKLLVGDGRGLTVVGDDDQSIYAWRGAQPENLLTLKQDYHDLKIIKLEQNYRSLNRILQTANQLISNNPRPFEKQLWSDFGIGDPIQVVVANEGEHEAERIASQILHHRFQARSNFCDYAVLYRGNHQARVFEQKFRELHIPYHLSGGMSFFDSTEIRDLMAYLRLLINSDDDNAFLRAVSSPRRGVGSATLEKIADYSASNNLSLYSAAQQQSCLINLSTRAAAGLRLLATQIDSAQQCAESTSLATAVAELLDAIDYQAWLVRQSDTPIESDQRWGNIQELIDWLTRMQRNEPSATAADLISSLSLYDMLDREQDEVGERVSLMTLHAAKGLEFNNVFIVGLEEGILPHHSSEDDSKLEEERRLLYVGITRAQQRLTLSWARRRKKWGQFEESQPSRFFDELPAQHLQWLDQRGATDPDQRQQLGDAYLAQMKEILQ